MEEQRSTTFRFARLQEEFNWWKAKEEGGGGGGEEEEPDAVRSVETVKAFCECLRIHGWAKLSLEGENSGCSSVLTNMYDAARRAFELEEENSVLSSNYPYQEATEAGYCNATNLSKQFFAVRLCKNDQQLYKPSSLSTQQPPQTTSLPAPFEQQCLSTFCFLRHLSHQCLLFLSVGLQTQPEKLEQLLVPQMQHGEGEEAEENENDFSDSFLHVFKYEPSPDVELPCPPHTDSGLVTVIPCSDSAGLEILDWSTFSWVNVEQQANFPSDVVVLLGETVARLTCMHYQASVHRVSRPKSVRYSLPFQLRGHPKAILDSAGLASPTLGPIPPSLRPKVTLADFLG